VVCLHFNLSRDSKAEEDASVLIASHPVLSSASSPHPTILSNFAINNIHLRTQYKKTPSIHQRKFNMTPIMYLLLLLGFAASTIAQWWYESKPILIYPR
jgi:hypothetical protein